MMRAYVDTNILVDLVLSRQEFLPDAQRVFAIGYAGEAQLVVSDLSGQNVVDMLNSGWRDYEDATQHRSAIDTLQRHTLHLQVREASWLSLNRSIVGKYTINPRL